MATCNTEYFIGNGKVYVAPRTSAGAISGGWAELGDSDSLSINLSQTFADIYESCSGNNNIAAHVPVTTDWEFSVDALSFSKDNLARALYGTASVVSSGSAVDEPLVGYALNQPIFTAHPGISAVVVKDGATTLTLGTDYTVDAATGTITLISATNLTGPAPYTITASYTYAAYDKVVTATGTLSELAFRFVGINKVTQKNVIVDIHRVALNMTEAVNFIGNEYQKFTLSGMVLPDANGTVGDSQYVTIRKVS